MNLIMTYDKYKEVYDGVDYYAYNVANKMAPFVDIISYVKIGITNRFLC
ncbi:MAG: hypothetical protein RRX93_00990 [Bacteroidales bacterium]